MKEFPEERAREEHGKKQKKFTEKDLKKLLGKGQPLLGKFNTREKLRGFQNDFKILFAMLKDYAGGRYKNVPWYIISSIGAALAYVLLPLDAIPDFIPVAGFLDDASVFAFCLKMVGSEVEKYKKWKGSDNEALPETQP